MCSLGYEELGFGEEDVGVIMIAVRIRWKRSRWQWMVYYDYPKSPSNSYWLVPSYVGGIEY